MDLRLFLSYKTRPDWEAPVTGAEGVAMSGTAMPDACKRHETQQNDEAGPKWSRSEGQIMHGGQEEEGDRVGLKRL